MQTRTRLAGQLVTIFAVAAATIALPASAMASADVQKPHARPYATTATCRFQQIKTWLGIGNGSTTSRIYTYPLEFTNVGRSTCSLFGYPGVSGIVNGHQAGFPAARVGRKQLVTLGRGQTAYAKLSFRIAGKVPGCQPKSGARLKVFAPNQSGSTTIYGFTFTTCSNRRTLSVTSVHFGTGIPGVSS